jgi:hypothetical protein
MGTTASTVRSGDSPAQPVWSGHSCPLPLTLILFFSLRAHHTCCHSDRSCRAEDGGVEETGSPLEKCRNHHS